MSKGANITDAAQIKEAKFQKLFGDDPTMHVPASKETIARWRRLQPGPMLCFSVPREHPVVRSRFLPELLSISATKHMTVRPGEFFVFQIVVYATETGLFDLRVDNKNWCCFTPPGHLAANEVKTFWLGRSFGLEHHQYNEEFMILSRNGGTVRLKVIFQCFGQVLIDGGESDDNRMARLRWLNSSLGEEETVFPPYLPLRRQERTIFWLGHSLTLNESGLPQSITSCFAQDNQRADGPDEPLLKTSIRFGTATADFVGKLVFEYESEVRIVWHADGKIGTTPAKLRGTLEFDGFLSCEIILQTAEDIHLTLEPEKKKYWIGLGRHGGVAPQQFDWTWNARRNQDGCWIGDLSGGLRLRLRPEEYRSSLTNCYYHFDQLKIPNAWSNAGRGGISWSQGKLTAFTGERALKEKLTFVFDLQITPFHCLSVARQLQCRTWHPLMHSFELNASDPIENTDLDALKKQGVTRINIHHAVGMNPFINYPFCNHSLPLLKTFVQKAHAHGFEVGFYYTMRELSVHPAEFWPLLSTGEIFQCGLGVESRPATNDNGPHPWLGENLDCPFLPAWAEVIKNGPVANNIDIALETIPESLRLENFFLEGLRYLLEQCPIDGLYLDDISISRKGFQRLHRIFWKYRGKAPFIDFHAWNPYPFFSTARDFGRASVILRDMQHLPYLTELWLGESFDYMQAAPEYYLTEICGFPFGLTGQMLQDGGNPWRGLLYGMTSRYGWQGDPRSLWHFFDRFGIDGLVIELDILAPITVPAGIRTTGFVNAAGKRCYGLGSWETQSVEIELENTGYEAVEIPGFQPAAKERFCIAPGKGVVLTRVGEI